MTTAEHRPIGTVQRNTYGYTARCVRCQWEVCESSQDRAEEAVRNHADVTHPPVIPVYRKPEPLSVPAEDEL